MVHPQDLSFRIESPLFSLVAFSTTTTTLFFFFPLLCRLVEYIDHHKPKSKSFTLKSELLSPPTVRVLKNLCWNLVNPFENSSSEMYHIVFSHGLANSLK